MAVQKITNGSEVILKVDGWLDTQSSPELEKALAKKLSPIPSEDDDEEEEEE